MIRYTFRLEITKKNIAGESITKHYWFDSTSIKACQRQKVFKILLEHLSPDSWELFRLDDPPVDPKPGKICYHP